MNNQELELETWSGKSLKAWTDAARVAKLVLRAPLDLDSGDYPGSIYGPLRRFRSVISKRKGEY